MKFAKNILVLGITSALSLCSLNYSHAAIYKVVEVDKSAEGYTYGGKLNIKAEMAVSSTNSYNFPVQFQYFEDSDFDRVILLSRTRHDYYFGLEEIEDTAGFDERAKAGDATANELAWSKLYLRNQNESSSNFAYQVVADTRALINPDASDPSVESTETCIFDKGFATDSTEANCTGELTYSTIDVIEGVTDGGVAFGTATAPYLPMEEFTDSNGTIRQHWLREHGQRGFFSLDNGATIYPVTPIETRYGGGFSALFDMNENGVAVGSSSYKLSEGLVEYILGPTTGCEEPNRYNLPKEICIQNNQSRMYHIQAFKASLSATGEVETEQLGLLVTPHADDPRAFSSQALAVNNHGVAVGYAHGWDNTDVTTPESNERMTGSYAVIFKEDEAGNKQVFDFNQPHYKFRGGTVNSFSKARDINDNGIVVGYTTDVDNGWVKKFFYVDSSLPDDEMEIIIPSGFFKSSKSTAFSVSNSGIIIGEAEIEAHNDSERNPRRTVGFMYELSSEIPKMVDLNTLLECQSDYTVITAKDINGAGQISATAVMKSESYDAKGEAILDENGDPVLIDVVRAVLLDPIADGEIEDCGFTEEKVERQGASFGSIAIFSLLSLLGLRRRQFNR
ncbi:MAG: DUF3466 family protein [Colwellia sp.]|nr:DUF3466 family protein [Colwellia sp.]